MSQYGWVSKEDTNECLNQYGRVSNEEKDKYQRKVWHERAVESIRTSIERRYGQVSKKGLTQTSV